VEEKRIIGDDGSLVRASIAATLTSGTFAVGWWRIGALAASNSRFGTLEVGDLYYAPVSVAGTAGDAAYAITTTDLVDLSGWSLELAADEVEVTVLADTYKKYRKGKMDANGTASFIFIKGETDTAGNLANYFFKEAVITASGTVSVSARSNDSLFLIGYIDNETTAGQYKSVTAFEVEFFNFSLPMNSSEAVSMEVPFRLVGAVDPILYRIANP
jgi:hypothetical protein